ncbi:MAG: hypothetical protein ACO1NX_03915 [Chitinophagaceae bacterium]
MPQRNSDKIRKSEAQKRFEEADNAGRFAGNDADAQNARAQAKENIRQDAQSTGTRRGMDSGEIMDADNVRPGQGNMLEEEAQNIGKDRGSADRLDSGSETEKARNKATHGIKESRDTGSSDDRSRNSGSR